MKAYTVELLEEVYQAVTEGAANMTDAEKGQQIVFAASAAADHKEHAYKALKAGDEDMAVHLYNVAAGLYMQAAALTPCEHHNHDVLRGLAVECIKKAERSAR